jgi:hypothetical protein
MQRAEPRVEQEVGVGVLGVCASKDRRDAGLSEAHRILEGGGRPGDALVVSRARGIVPVRGGAGMERAGGGSGADAEVGVIDV